MADSFFVPLGDDRYQATGHTTGPWDAGAQHGGPPTALLARAVQRCAPRDDMIVARVTCEILGPVPVGELSVAARVARPGRSVEMLEASAAAGGREVARVSAWRVRRTDGASVPSRAPAPGPLAGAEPMVPGFGRPAGYMTAMEWRIAAGALNQPGPATVWGRMRYPLVAGEEPAPLERVLMIADSGNGFSAELSIKRWLFINPELTVHLYREAVGEWICLDAQTAIAAGGAGLASSVLSDSGGPLGVGAQSLLIAPRPAP